MPEAHLRRGGPTGSANPLLWAHSEYLRLLRSSHDGKVFDQIPEVVARYRDGEDGQQRRIWLPKHPIPQAAKGKRFAFARLSLSAFAGQTDNWKTSQDSQSQATGIGGEYFDIGPDGFQSQLDFTFFWPDRGANGGEWEGQNYLVQAR